MRSGINLRYELAATVLLMLIPGFVTSDNAASSTKEQGAESATATSSVQSHVPSDRENLGLRGPVEQCIEESTNGQDNWRSVDDTKYDPDGRMYQSTHTNNDGTKVLESLTYEAEGHLLRTIRTGQAWSSDTIYNYDSQGRLTGIAGQSDWTTSFEYDDQGRKTRITKSKVKASSGADLHQSGFSIERENVDLFAAPPPGGWVTTSFNDHDQPIETRVYESNGELMSRLTRSYDDKERVAESTAVIESSDSLLSPATRQRLASDPEALEKMEAALAEFLGPQRVLARTSYVYDHQGRVSEKRNDFGPSENILTKITYNDHGDDAEEIRTTLNPPRAPEEDIVNFSYQYDTFGNWTEKIASSPATANEPSKVWTIARRTITYY